MTDETTSGPRRIAVVSDLAGLHKAIREWVAELGVSRETIDHVGGLPDRHAAKLLAPTPLKHFGHVSLGLMLGATGLDLWVVVNDEKLNRIKGRLTRKQHVRASGTIGPDSVVQTKTLGDMVRAARLGGQARAKLPKWRLRQIARKAWRTRRRQNNQPS
jgi:hypothetical protein